MRSFQHHYGPIKGRSSAIYEVKFLTFQHHYGPIKGRRL